MRAACVIAVTLSVVGLIVWGFCGRLLYRIAIRQPDAAAVDSTPQSSVVTQLLADPPGLLIRRSGKPAHHVTIALRNPTGNTIRILSVHKSCECSMPGPLSVNELAAGESTDLKLTLHPPEFGEQSTVVRISTDADAPELEIPITLVGEEPPPIHAYSELQPVPDRLEFRGFVPGETMTRDIRVYTAEQPDAPAWIIGAVSTDRRLECNLLPGFRDQPHRRSPDGHIIQRAYTVRFETQVPHWDAGRVRMRARFVYADKTPDSTRAVTVDAVCSPPIGVAPKTLFISASALPADVGANPTTRRVILRSNDGHRLEIVDAACVWSGATVSACDAGSDNETACICVEISAAPDAVSGQEFFKTDIRIETNHPLVPIIEVPLYIELTRSDTPG